MHLTETMLPECHRKPTLLEAIVLALFNVGYVLMNDQIEMTRHCEYVLTAFNDMTSIQNAFAQISFREDTLTHCGLFEYYRKLVENMCTCYL